MGASISSQESENRHTNLPLTSTIANEHKFQFHDVHGINIELSPGKEIAKRTKSFCYGIAFSNNPIENNQFIHIKLEKVEENWSGVMRFGVTTVDPSTLNSASLPRFACPDLSNRPEFWMKALPDEFAIEKNVLSFCVNSNGFLKLWINYENRGSFVGGIPMNTPLWVIVDIYGNTTALRFLDDVTIPTLTNMASEHHDEVNGDAIINSDSPLDEHESSTATDLYFPALDIFHDASTQELRRVLRLSSNVIILPVAFSMKHGHGVCLIDDQSWEY